jgi:hypothetical protein
MAAQRHHHGCLGFDTVRRFGCHVNPSPRLACHGLLADSQFGFDLDDLNHRWQWGDVFFETVASSKGKQYNFCIVVVAQHDALLAGFRKLNFVGELSYLIGVVGHRDVLLRR